MKMIITIIFMLASICLIIILPIYLKKNNKINKNIVEQLLDISSTRAKNILNNMCENKLIVMVGSGKNIIYVLKKL